MKITDRILETLSTFPQLSVVAAYQSTFERLPPTFYNLCLCHRLSVYDED